MITGTARIWNFRLSYQTQGDMTQQLHSFEHHQDLPWCFAKNSNCRAATMQIHSNRPQRRQHLGERLHNTRTWKRHSPRSCSARGNWSHEGVQQGLTWKVTNAETTGGLGRQKSFGVPWQTQHLSDCAYLGKEEEKNTVAGGITLSKKKKKRQTIAQHADPEFRKKIITGDTWFWKFFHRRTSWIPAKRTRFRRNWGSLTHAQGDTETQPPWPAVRMSRAGHHLKTGRTVIRQLPPPDAQLERAQVGVAFQAGTQRTSWYFEGSVEANPSERLPAQPPAAVPVGNRPRNRRWAFCRSPVPDGQPRCLPLQRI